MEEIKDKCSVSITNEDVFMATALGDFINMVVAVKRGGSGQKELEFDSIKMNVNKMDISFATQLYIDGKFVNATSGKKLDVYNPHDESLVCQVESAGLSDVDKVTNQYYYTNDQSNHCLNKIRQI